MMQLWLATQSAKNYFNQRIVQECQERGINVETFNPYISDIPLDADLIIWRVSGVNYNDADLDKIATTASIASNSLNISNPPQTLRLCRDKWQLYQAMKSKLPLAHCQKLTPLITNLTDPLELNEDEFVLKTRRGNQGRGVELIQKKQWHQKRSKLQAKNDWRYLIQPRLRGVEYRVFLLNGVAPIVLQRTASGFQANFHQDGSATLVKKVPLKLLDIIEKVNQHIHYHYLALDVIVGEVSEIIDINAVCGIEQLEKVTKQNIASKILTKLLSFS